MDSFEINKITGCGVIMTLLSM